MNKSGKSFFRYLWWSFVFTGIAVVVLLGMQFNNTDAGAIMILFLLAVSPLMLMLLIGCVKLILRALWAFKK